MILFMLAGKRVYVEANLLVGTPCSSTRHTYILHSEKVAQRPEHSCFNIFLKKWHQERYLLTFLRKDRPFELISLVCVLGHDCVSCFSFYFFFSKKKKK